MFTHLFDFFKLRIGKKNNAEGGIQTLTEISDIQISLYFIPC